ncbi:MAG: hypothetical protein KDC55_02010 [Ignavibacteriae bacterium]|nr:hypothetical protein [Ignavibacteriota bacterium]
MRTINITILLLFLTSCELFVIGNNRPPKEVIDITQETAIGAAMLFTTELQLENVPAAAQLLSDNTGRFSAVRQQEEYYNLARLTRILNNRKITRVIADTITLDLHNIKLEYDYVKEFSFSMKEIDSLWYIMDFSQIK